MGISIADLLIQSITLYSPVSFGILAVVLPGGLGVALAWYFTRSMQRSTNIATRIMIFIGMLSITQFADVYVKALGTSGLDVSKAFVPNLVFVISMSVYILLRYDPSPEPQPS